MHQTMPRIITRLLALAMLVSLMPLLPTTRVVAQNGSLITNAGFENGSAAWDLCGSAQIVQAGSPGVTAAMVYSGQRALRLTYTEDNRCGSPVFDPHGAAAQSFQLPANAESVTVSFWYSRVGNPVWPVRVNLAEIDGFGFLTELSVENLTGWHQFRHQLTAEQVEQVRGKTVELKLESIFSTATADVPDADNPGFYIDDVRVVGTVERTGESPRPADLRSDGSSPIVYLDAQLGGVARMNADGSGARKIYQSAMTPLSPAWSSRGDRVVVIQGSLTPEDTSDVKVNNAFISIIRVFSPNGSGARDLLRTAGLPGFRPTVPTPGDPERPALDVTASFVTWAPDDRTIAVSLCARNRLKNGSASDPICWIELFDTATGQSRGKFEPGFAPKWSSTNRILYQNDDSLRDKPVGIYEVNVGAGSAEQLLVPGTGRPLRPSFYTDRFPTWSPDGSKFVTVRNIDGYHRDGSGSIVAHYGIMLFDRNELIGRQILLIDQGDSPGNLSWSPDGNFILYSLYQGQGADVWWLDTRTGATGRLTTNGASVAADWRVRCPNPTCSDTSAVYLPLVRR
ncbi:MAG: hypothetical protein MUD01_28975 [Chloroflexaceae bacterium]|nr:hypothetical protein [Chloroflexaceae bacterium]